MVSARNYKKAKLDMLKLEGSDLYDEMVAIQDKFEKSFVNRQLTPDYPELALQDSHYIFVYGTLKNGFHNHYLLKNRPCVGTGFSKFKQFFMALTTGSSSFPVLFSGTKAIGKTGVALGRCYGEVYQVPPADIKKLDELESNTVMYRRVPITIETIIDGNGTKKMLKCWVYLGVKSFWQDRSDNLTPSPLLTANKDKTFKYHNFMKLYENMFMKKAPIQ